MANPIKDPDTSWRDAGTDFIKSEVSGGAVLLVAAIAAVAWANAPFGETYKSFWETNLTLGFGDVSITEDLKHWVNDGLMVLFFFVVGLEIKRELVVGELNDRSKAVLPLFAAVGGVLLPGVIYLLLNAGGEGADGWAIPMATDIAFAVAVLALLGKRIPPGVRLLLLSIAIIDDVIAILIIAVFYSKDISLVWLAVGAAGILTVLLMQRLDVSRVFPYVVVGVVVWIGFLSSGVHATIAGVILGLMTPAHPIKGRHVIEDLEHRLHPWTSMVIVPLFALANAGIVISAIDPRRCRRQHDLLGCGCRSDRRKGDRDRIRRSDRPAPGLGQAAQGGAGFACLGRRRAGRDRIHRVTVHRRALLRSRAAARIRQDRHLHRLDRQRPDRRIHPDPQD